MDRRRPRNIPSRPLAFVVDDDDDTREMYVVSLAALGFEAIAVAEYAQACRRASEMHPDIIVTDLPRREADGWQLLQDLQREPRTETSPSSCSLAIQRRRCANMPNVRAVSRFS